MAKMRKSRRSGRREVEEPPRLRLEEEEDETPTMDLEEKCGGGHDEESVGDEEDAFLDDCDLYSIAKQWIRERERSREDVHMVTALLYGYIRSSTRMNVKAASTSTAKAVGKDEKTVRTWMASLKSNGGIPLPFGGRKYHRVSIINDEDCCRRAATAWIRENASQKGVGNMTIKDFQRYLNTDLLPGMHVPPEFPKSVSKTTAKRFLHDLGFVRQRTSQKSVYMDGHEREDVIQYRSEYIARLQSIERRHQIPPLPSDAVLGEPLPGIVGSPGAPKQLVTIFHDETVFQSNEDQEWAWAQEL